MTIWLRKKSQLTLPASIVSQLGLQEGDALDCQCHGDTIVLTPATRMMSLNHSPEIKKQVL